MRVKTFIRNDLRQHSRKDHIPDYHSVPENMKTSIFEKPIIPQILNIKNMSTTNAKSIDLHTIRHLIKCSLKAMSHLTIFEIFLFKLSSVFTDAKWSTVSKWVKTSVANQKRCVFENNYLKIDWHTVIEGLQWFLFCLILFNSLSTRKFEKVAFWDVNNTTTNIKNQ